MRGPRPSAAYASLEATAILEHLSAFDAILAGTIPIDIGVDGSDLDIICEVHETQAFIEAVRAIFPDASLQLEPHCCILRTHSHGWDYEIYGAPHPVWEQNAVRHMLIEDRLLQERGSEFREQVLELKRCGIKTEPAFAQLLGLSGNPYQALLDL